MSDLVKDLRNSGWYLSKPAADRIEKLEAALQPFAEWADAYEPDEGDEHELAWNHRATIGMLRAARKTLEGKDD
jgi:hypothetical protein